MDADLRNIETDLTFDEKNIILLWLESYAAKLICGAKSTKLYSGTTVDMVSIETINYRLKECKDILFPTSKEETK